MLGISLPELVVISFAALLVLGPKELPVVLKKIGQIVGEIRKLADEFMTAVNQEVESPKKYIKDLKGNLQETYDIEDLINDTKAHDEKAGK